MLLSGRASFVQHFYIILSILVIKNFKNSLQVSTVASGMAVTAGFTTALIVLNKTLGLWDTFGTKVVKAALTEH